MIQKKVFARVAAVFLIGSTMASCTETSQLEEVILPATIEQTAGFPRVPVKTDTTLTLRALYRPTNGCGRFSRLDSVDTSQGRMLTVYAAYPSDEMEAICTEEAKLISVSFRYHTTTPGKYYFRFWQANDKYLLDSVEVQ